MQMEPSHTLWFGILKTDSPVSASHAMIFPSKAAVMMEFPPPLLIATIRASCSCLQFNFHSSPGIWASMDQQRIRPASSPVTKRFASGETTAADTATGPCAAGRRESSLKPLKARSSTEPSAKPTIMLPSKALATQWTRHEAWNKTQINLKRDSHYIPAVLFWFWEAFFFFVVHHQKKLLGSFRISQTWNLTNTIMVWTCGHQPGSCEVVHLPNCWCPSTSAHHQLQLPECCLEHKDSKVSCLHYDLIKARHHRSILASFHLEVRCTLW